MSEPSTLTKQRTAQEIPPDGWIPFLAEFTRENRGAHARLEIVGADTDIGYNVEAENVPFEGVSADIKDRERTVWLTFRGQSDNHVTHGVHNAKVIRVLPPADNGGPVLEIEGNDGTKTILQLSNPEAYTLPPSEAD